MVRDIKFDKVHAAAYSTRPGTIAARLMVDDVQPAEKQRRLDIIEEIQEQVSAEINSKLMYSRQEVLVEGVRRGRWFGRNRNDKLVFFDSPNDLTGKMVDVRIDRTGPWSLQGEIMAKVGVAR